MGFIVAIIIGAIAGWLAGQIVKGEGMGTLVNIVVGIVGALIASWVFPALGMGSGEGSSFIGQILYSSTLEHIKEYGTLKAMGARNGAVVRVIVYQALMTAAAGFLAGGVLAVVARAAMNTINLSVALSPALFVATAVLTVAMCSGSSLLSITKVLRLDPASVFKG